MDPLTSLALTVTIAAVALYALYWVVRRAVAAGIRDDPQRGRERRGTRRMTVPRLRCVTQACC